MRIDFEEDPTTSELAKPQDLEHPNQIFHNKLLSKSKSLKSGKKVNIQSKLKEFVQQKRVQRIQEQFVRKIRRLTPLHTIPKSIKSFTQDSTTRWDMFSNKLQNTSGLKMNEILSIVWNFINLFHLLVLNFVICFCMAFQNKNNENFQAIGRYSAFFILFDILVNFFTQRFDKGQNLKNLKEIGLFYLRGEFIIDVLFLIFVQIFWDEDIFVQTITVFLVFIKLFKALSKMQAFEHMCLTNLFREKYYGIAKAIFFNFLIGHIISIILILMTHLSPGSNWIISKNLQHEPFISQYIWSYYWGANIILTVGFGDFAATNETEALILIFVETFGCIMLAYNINTVGSILTDINEKSRERRSQLKTFLTMSSENNIPVELTKEIVNFIDQSFEIKEKFLYEKHDEIIESLPKNIKSEYKKQANQNLLDKIPFISMLSKKGRMQLAEKIERKIAHPEELIRKRGQLCRLTIIFSGEIALICSGVGPKLNGKVIHSIPVSKKDKSRLISLKFLKNQLYNYNVKSLTYSVVYQMTMEELKETLKDYPYDYELLCEIQDKDEYYLGENQIEDCKSCLNQRHTLFDCPKLHYIPNRSHIVHKKRWGKLGRKQQREEYFQRKSERVNGLLNILENMIYCADFIEQIYGSERLEELEENARVYQRAQKNYVPQGRRGSFLRKSKTPSNKKISRICSIDFQKIQNMIQVKKKEENLYDGFWAVECDLVHMFSHYMRNFNADQIKNI